MNRSFDGLGVTGLLLGMSLVGIVGCDRPAADLTEWTVADHNHRADNTRRPAGTPKTYAKPSERNQLVDVTWMKQCSECHGKRGRGDGPTAPMVKARDLSKLEWQSSVTDESIAKVIREGREKMPAFNLPDSMVQELVGHIRKMSQKPKNDERGDGEAEEAEQPTPTTAPASTRETQAAQPSEKAPAARRAAPPNEPPTPAERPKQPPAPAPAQKAEDSAHNPASGH
jgi:mono/diheme cytochrome c family protein